MATRATDPRLRSAPATSTPPAPPPPAPPTPPPATSTPSTTLPSATPTLRFCTVCASNNNRSMEAHLRLTTPNTTTPTAPQTASKAQTTYPTLSFGTGSLVRLPGPNITSPNVYPFNTTSYARMYDELQAKDERLYRANGILPMLERNKNVKFGPERWQDWAVGVPRTGHRRVPNIDGNVDEEAKKAEYPSDAGHHGTESGVVDVVITCEERCWDAVLDDLLTRGSPLNRPVHVFNVDIKDNHEEAMVGGRAIRELADLLDAGGGGGEGEGGYGGV